ncbi:MAG: hypothetical protein J0H73_11745 [Salana multivorans]|uniref:hypothetical protein n=1 Tax=Salana multivorans TaxID=120377 RepID=UPI0009681CBE|nr:hypothetical protein [Salana multivorans]MBN8882972.1 hypothetical protein [Salana multivorans]OJX94074.1 MAG: hypothetical protein BGO96_09715 [Micrococcales bacterium 73-15]
MSADTKAALAEAIAAHIADECAGDTPGAWIVLTETTTLTEWADDTASIHVTSHGSRLTIRGLIETWRDIDRDSYQHGDD